MYAERETYVFRGAVREPSAEGDQDAERNVYDEGHQHTERSRHAERTLSHRWPRVVREVAVDSDGWRVEAEPLPDPEDEIFLLGERCAQAYMQADALHYRAMKLLAEFDRRSGWRDTGFSS